MKNIFDYKIVIIDNNGKIFSIPYKLSTMHQDSLNKLAKEMYALDFITETELLKQKNIIIKNSGNKMLAIHLPEELSEEQLHQLDYIKDFFKEAEYISAEKYNEQGKKVEEYYFDNINNDDILGTPQERFSKELIQSYYNKKTKRR